MTIQEMYDWAKKNDCLDIPVATIGDKTIYDVVAIAQLTKKIPDYSIEHDRVVIASA